MPAHGLSAGVLAVDPDAEEGEAMDAQNVPAKGFIARVVDLRKADASVRLVVVGGGNLAKFGLDAATTGAIGGVAFDNKD